MRDCAMSRLDELRLGLLEGCCPPEREGRAHLGGQLAALPRQLVPLAAQGLQELQRDVAVRVGELPRPLDVAGAEVVCPLELQQRILRHGLDDGLERGGQLAVHVGAADREVHLGLHPCVLGRPITPPDQAAEADHIGHGADSAEGRRREGLRHEPQEGRRGLGGDLPKAHGRPPAEVEGERQANLTLLVLQHEDHGVQRRRQL